MSGYYTTKPPEDDDDDWPMTVMYVVLGCSAFICVIICCCTLCCKLVSCKLGISNHFLKETFPAIVGKFKIMTSSSAKRMKKGEVRQREGGQLRSKEDDHFLLIGGRLRILFIRWAKNSSMKIQMNFLSLQISFSRWWIREPTSMARSKAEGERFKRLQSIHGHFQATSELLCPRGI